MLLLPTLRAFYYPLVPMAVEVWLTGPWKSPRLFQGVHEIQTISTKLTHYLSTVLTVVLMVQKPCWERLVAH